MQDLMVPDLSLRQKKIVSEPFVRPARLRRDMTQHPKIVQLELLVTHEAEAGVADHVESCASCQMQLVWLQQAREQAHAGVPVLQLDESTQQAMLARIDRHASRLSAISSRHTTLRRLAMLAAPVAAAAALVFFFRTSPVFSPATSAPVMPAIAMPGDVNADGRVDIVDALQLAQVLERGSATDSSWDVDGNQRVDHRDVEQIARRAVRIEVRP